MDKERPSPESQENPTLRQRVIEALRDFNEHGGDRKVASDLVTEWEKMERDKRDRGEQDDLAVFLSFAELYREAGVIAAAVSSYVEALHVAVQDDNWRACADIADKIKEVVKKSQSK